MRKTLCTAVLLSLAAASSAAARNLGEIVREAEAEWLIGTWQMKDDSGDTTTIIYKWALDKNLILLDFRSGNWNSTAMIFYDPAADEVSYVAVDDRGGTLKGNWTLKEGNPLVVYRMTMSNGQTRRVGVLHKKLDENAFQGEVYPVSDTGQLADQPVLTVEMKRQPR